MVTLLARRAFGSQFRGMHSSKAVEGGAAARLKGLDSIQAQYLLEDRCILVDEADRVIGSASKGDCHHVSTQALHRAFSVFLFTPERKLLLQKRSASKITFPAVWTNSCCSHPLHVPDEMQTGAEAPGVRRAAQRKLLHELGIPDLDMDRMQVMGRFLYKADSDKEWLEHELDYALVVTDFDASTMNPNPEEVSEVMEVDPHKLDEMIKSKRFSPWFSLFYQFQFLNSWWKNLDNLDRLKDPVRIHHLN